MKFRNLIFIFFCLLPLIGNTQSASVAAHQKNKKAEFFSLNNVLGKPGYILAPSASEIPQPFQMGVSWLPPEISFSDNEYNTSSQDGSLIYHFGVSLTDFFQVNINITYGINRPRTGIGDRQLDFRFRLLTERKHWPGLILILAPPGAYTNYLAHNAVVATKTFSFNSTHKILEVTGGYGLPYNFAGLSVINKTPFEFYDKRAGGLWYLNSFFAAAAIHPAPWLSFSTEITNRTAAAALTFRKSNYIMAQINWFPSVGLGGSLNFNIPLDFDAPELRHFRKRNVL